jgi:hypothetical protein
MRESSPKVPQLHPTPAATVAAEVVHALAELLGGLPDVVHRVRAERARPDCGSRPADLTTERCA